MSAINDNFNRAEDHWLDIDCESGEKYLEELEEESENE